MFFLCRRSEQRATGLSCCLLTAVFFLFRVCVKKSTQERLALKILIDRPKARNEVRGNIAVMVIDVSCVGRRRFSLVCLPARYQSSLINSWFSSLVTLSPKLLLSVCLGFAVCKIVFLWQTACLAASPCHQQPSVLIKRLTQQWDMQSKQATQTSHTHWTVKAVTDKRICTNYCH